MRIKRSRTTRMQSAAFLLALSMALAACGSSGSDTGAAAGDGDTETSAPEDESDGDEATGGGDGETLSIGVMGPMSGDYASYGLGWWNAARLAAQEINEADACGGYVVESIQGDSQADAGAGISAANDLVARGVYAMSGPIFSSVTLPVTEFLEDSAVPAFVGSSANDVTRRGLNYVFRLAYSANDTGPFDAEMSREITGAETVVAVHDNSSFALSLVEEFVKAFEADGGEVVATETITPGESDYSSALTRIRDHDADLVYYAGYFTEGAQLLSQGREMGIERDVPGHGWWFGNSNQDPSFIEIAGDAAEGALLGTFPSPETDPAMGEYADSYEEAWGEPPTGLGHWGYDTIYVICKGIEAAGTSDVDAVVNALKSPDFEHQGVSGPISFDKTGDREFPPLSVIVVEDGKFTVYDE